MRIVREKKGQFIIIAAMLISIMMISVSTVIYGTVTYYRQERWEEYVTIVDSLRTASSNLLYVSLASYSQNQASNQTVFRDHLNQWVRDVRKAYPAYGVDMWYTPSSGVYSAYGMNLNYNLGLAHTWNQPLGFTAANATFSLNIASVGLTGYSFSSSAFLKTNLLDATYSTGYVLIHLTVDRDGPKTILNLVKSNFPVVKLNGNAVLQTDFTYAKCFYSSTYKYFVYELRINSAAKPSNAEVTVQDARGIRSVSYTSTVL